VCKLTVSCPTNTQQQLPVLTPPNAYTLQWLHDGTNMGRYMERLRQKVCHAASRAPSAFRKPVILTA